MTDRIQTKKYLLEAIQSLIEADKIIHSHTDHKISHLYTAERLKNKSFRNIDPSGKLEFSAGNRNKYLLWMLAFVLALLTPILYFTNSLKGGVLIVVCLASLFCIMLLKRMMTNQAFKNKIILSPEGIQFNDQQFFWEQVLTTHLQNISYITEKREDEEYLLIGDTTGTLHTFDVSKINYCESFFKGRDIRILGHYIEVYKAKHAELTDTR